jgi:hypothetical protein
MAPLEGRNAPVIAASFASRQARQGETWKVFLQAEDRDGDMNRIVCTLETPGGGVQPASLIKIREDRRRNLSGYIFLNTETFRSPFASCRLTVCIQDKNGNTSNPVSFSLSLNPRAVQETPPPGSFPDEEIGPVQISLPPLPAP